MRPLSEARSRWPMVVAAVLTAVLAPMPTSVVPVRASTRAPKAVFIVGPTNGLTDSNLVDAGRMADQAAAEGMEVRRVFFPDATWDNVLANIQGASLVVYMGHGYGWPSPYTTRMTESRQNGFGLNSYSGSGRSSYTYYGAAPIRQNIALAPNAVVLLVHGCYAAGNGEPGMATPSQELARERVDNYASGFLAVGARAVFAFGWNQRLNYPRALATSDSSMDEFFMTAGGGSPAGYVGWRDAWLDSTRTPGATIHLDPHPTSGYYRAVTGDLSMSAADWRAGASGAASEVPPVSEPPQIAELIAGSLAQPASFHPNGDGLDDELLISHTVTRASDLDVTIRNDAGDPVRAFTVSSATGAGTSSWDGRNQTGAVVPDGQYTLTYVARDEAGNQGEPASVSALVLTGIAVARPTRGALHVSDTDALARSTTFTVALNQPTRLTWRILDIHGSVLRSIRDDQQVAPGTLSFTWDGRADDGVWVADGTYRGLASAQTGLGAYEQERSVFVGAFHFNVSNGAPARGEQVTLNFVSTERLDRAPMVRVTQDGISPWAVVARETGDRTYRVAVKLVAGGPAGTVAFEVTGIDARGGRQSSGISLPLQ